MPVWEGIYLWASAHPYMLILPAAAVLLISLALAAMALSTAKQLKRRYQKLMMGREDLDLEALLGEQGELLEKELRQGQRVQDRLQEMEAQLQRTVAGVELVRYNAFRETGSDLSFSLALLDREFDGVIVTSLFGRDESRCYGKPVEKGRSNHHLSEEENQALEGAKRRIGDRERGTS